MIANQETMVDTFWDCNEKYFDNSLPTPWFETVNSISVIGKFEYHKNKRNSKKPIRDQVIKMSDCFDYPEKDFIETMVHEMIHYYIAWNRIKVLRSHGRVFMRMANEMKEKYGLNVTKKNGASSFKLTENAPKLVKRKRLFGSLVH
jgi:hypothetical protein